MNPMDVHIIVLLELCTNTFYRHSAVQHICTKENKSGTGLKIKAFKMIQYFMSFKKRAYATILYTIGDTHTQTHAHIRQSFVYRKHSPSVNTTE